MGDDTPVEVVYASEVYSQMNTVAVTVNGVEIFIVVEPGHDPYELWHDLMGFLSEESIAA